MSERDPTKRFSGRVDYYVKYRPQYPQAIIPYLEETIGFSEEWEIADVGSGTGILSRLFLENGNVVYGVEPNPEMRAAGETWLAGYERFTSVPGRAEATTLPADSVDLVTVGQAFHWFDHDAAKAEFRRVLRPGAGGHVMLVWNGWKKQDEAFTQAYEQVVQRYGIDYTQVNDKRDTRDDPIFAFFAPAGVTETTFETAQAFDFDGLRGRALSSSYAPLPGHPNHEPLLDALRDLFDRFQEDGVLPFPYTTRLFLGRLVP